MAELTLEQCEELLKKLKFHKAVIFTHHAMVQLELQKLQMMQKPEFELSELVKMQEKIDEQQQMLDRVSKLAEQSGVKLFKFK